MKISKARLKQIIVEELEAVMNEDEETEDENVEEGFISSQATRGPTHRDRPSYQRATVSGRVADRGTPTLDAAADALGMSPSQLMMDLAAEMGVDISGGAAEEEPPLPMPEEGE
tara:strand:+ start:31 stop:372 length:342 start_codon:yes stop_codon:yes gene_type:complete